MPRRTIEARGFLGEDSDSSEEFRSAELDTNETSYGLERSPQHSQPATTQNNVNIQPPARKKTGALRPQDTPRTRSTISQSRPTLRSETGRRKKKKPMHRNMYALREIQRLQSSTKILIPRLPFARLVKEILFTFNSDINRITKSAMEALQESTEIYVTYQLQDAYTLTLHRGQVTLKVKDMELLRFLRPG